jgi:hypothetical protein
MSEAKSAPALLPQRSGADLGYVQACIHQLSGLPRPGQSQQTELPEGLLYGGAPLGRTRDNAVGGQRWRGWYYLRSPADSRAGLLAASPRRAIGGGRGQLDPIVERRQHAASPPKQPHVSNLMRNRAGLFSVERLMEFLTELGQDVQITVRPTRKRHGKVSVVVAA